MELPPPPKRSRIEIRRRRLPPIPSPLRRGYRPASPEHPPIEVQELAPADDEGAPLPDNVNKVVEELTKVIVKQSRITVLLASTVYIQMEDLHSHDQITSSV